MTLDEVRLEIDAVDSDLRELFKQRIECSRKIIEVKSKSGDSVYKGDREKELILKAGNNVDPEIKNEYVAFVKHTMEVSRNFQYLQLVDMGKISELDDLLKDVSKDNKLNEISFDISLGDYYGIDGVLTFIRDYGIKLLKIEYLQGDYRINVEGKLDDRRIKAMLLQMLLENKNIYNIKTN